MDKQEPAMNASFSAAFPRTFSRRAALLGACGMLGAAACGAGSSGPATYGAKVRFTRGMAISFPDFDLTYVGRRHEATKVYPRGFDYDDFKISRGGKSVTASWSAGTGLIGPRSFEFGGQSFTLELKHADRYKGWLKDDELVIEKK
jgi:hypothetical protein